MRSSVKGVRSMVSVDKGVCVCGRCLLGSDGESNDGTCGVEVVLFLHLLHYWRLAIWPRRRHGGMCMCLASLLEEVLETN